MRSRLFVFLFVPFLFLSTILVITTDTHAAVQPRTRTTPPLIYGIDEVPNQLPLTTERTSFRLQEQSASLLSWSRVAYYAYREGNWDIYLAHDDGSSEQRLTYDSGTDLGPNLDRGSQRVTFSSDRDGDNDIFTIYTNGTSLKQLTHNSYDELNPCWSPDGSKIVFQSNRDGQYEVYVMAASGQSQQRLTQHPAYDGQPSWSPDGSKLLFVSDRSGGWRIWVMDADGKNPTQLSQQPLSENPIWSPDGNQIAYDADGNNDGWLELWVMNADGTNQRKVYEPGYPYDAWMSSWSPDGKRLAFTRAEWLQYQGNWYWVGAQTASFNLVNSVLVDMHPRDPVVSPHWQTTDNTEPVTSLGIQPVYQRNAATLAWIANDPGGAGILQYDVQYRLGPSGVWTDWRMNVTPGSSNLLNFAPLSGETVYFRTRAIDRAFNAESWPGESGDTFTTFYDWAIVGTAYDNRGTPLIGISADDQQYAFDILASNNTGEFSTYFSGQQTTFAPAWSGIGYLNLPATTFPAEKDVTQDVIMPPADNVVKNWGFETGNFSGADWSARGLPTPVLVTTNPHTGQYAAFLGESIVFSPTLKIHGDGNSFTGGSDIRLDGDGRLHTVWWTDTTQTGIGLEIFYSSRHPDGTWDTPLIISNAPAVISAFSWDVSATGQVDVAWITEDGANSTLFYTRRSSAGIWANPVQIASQTDFDTYTDLTDPLIKIDSSNKAHLVWAGNKTRQYYYSQAPANGTMTSPLGFAPLDGFTAVDMIPDGTGKLHLLWSKAGNDVAYSYRAVSGSWSAREIIATGDYHWYQYFTVTSSGTVHVVWTRYGVHLYHRMRDVNGQWSPLKSLVTSSKIWDKEVSIGTTDSDEVYVIWIGQFQPGCETLHYAMIDASNNWVEQAQIPLSEHNICAERTWWGQGSSSSTPFVIVASDTRICTFAIGTNNLREPHCLDYAGNLYTTDAQANGMDTLNLLWYTNSGIFFSEIAPAQAAGSTSLQQQITIPAGTSHPTLSFLYRLETAEQGGSILKINTISDTASTTVYSTTQSTNGWTHQWLDLGDLAGQTITLTLELQQEIGTIPTQAFIDEVTVGNAYPDTWVAVTGGANYLPGEYAILTIPYGNRGGVDAGTGMITLTLPAEMQFVYATPAPSATTPTYSWNIAALPAGISGSISVVAQISSNTTLLDQISLTATFDSTTTEIAQQNNTAVYTFQIGKPTFLPFVMK